MPNDKVTLNPPIQYSWIWLVIGLSLLLAIILWFLFVIWLTRRKKLNTLAGLQVLPAYLDLNQLKYKYLSLIDQCYQSYQRNEITKRQLHTQLSMLTRSFVQEARQFPAPRLTLSDLLISPFPQLTRVISDLYPKEFKGQESGDPNFAVQEARDMVEQWF